MIEITIEITAMTNGGIQYKTKQIYFQLFKTTYTEKFSPLFVVFLLLPVCKLGCQLVASFLPRMMMMMMLYHAGLIVNLIYIK
jgi:hypothetical protein